MGFVAGQGWGMPFIVSPNYVPQDPEYTQHFKPEQQGCAECGGVSVPPQPTRTFPRQVLTCSGLKVIQTTKPPNSAPVSNREMDGQFGAYGGVGVTPTLQHTRVIGNNTRYSSNEQTITVDSQDVK